MDLSPHPNPVQVTGLPTMTEIAAGRNFCLAVAGDGTVWSWGSNNSFQLGQGQQVSQNQIPKQIPNFGSVAAVAGGNGHSVALKTDGSVWTWGSNDQGALGDASLENRFSPVRVTGLQTVNAPLFNPEGGRFNGPIDVTITCATPGATIHYTTNGMEPTQADPVIASGGTVRLTFFTTMRARAWKPGLVPSSATFATFDVILPPPQLLLEENGPGASQLVAVDSVLFLRDPFPIINPANWARSAADPNTRVIIFASSLPPLPANLVDVVLSPPSGFPQFLKAESVRAVPGSDFTQVVFRLPNNLPPGTCHIQLFVLGQGSTSGTIRIKP